MARKKGRKKGKAKWKVGGRKATISRNKGHKPVALLELYHSKMEKNLHKLEGIIKRRRASGAPRTISRSGAVKENTGSCDK